MSEPVERRLHEAAKELRDKVDEFFDGDEFSRKLFERLGITPDKEEEAR